MKWKELLKPDWGKILITILITLMFSILVINVFGINYDNLKIPTLVDFVGFIIFIVILAWPLSLLPSTMNTQTLFLPLGMFLLILYWYFLSCMIIWIYNKVKKKK
jgi:uncharacterized membrane protein AbrB (regulator of aidB expression)